MFDLGFVAFAISGIVKGVEDSVREWPVIFVDHEKQWSEPKNPLFNRDYPVPWKDMRKTCISCGSKTQPCCGH